MTETAMLKEHGTDFMHLKANNIVQAALADLKLRERKKAKTAEPEALYSFARRHVKRAHDVRHLIALAYFEPWVAQTTDKHSTLIVYGDREVLRQALIGVLDGSVWVPE